MEVRLRSKYLDCCGRPDFYSRLKKSEVWLGTKECSDVADSYWTELTGEAHESPALDCAYCKEVVVVVLMTFTLEP